MIFSLWGRTHESGGWGSSPNFEIGERVSLLAQTPEHVHQVQRLPLDLPTRYRSILLLFFATSTFEFRSNLRRLFRRSIRSGSRAGGTLTPARKLLSILVDAHQSGFFLLAQLRGPGEEVHAVQLVMAFLSNYHVGKNPAVAINEPVSPQ